MIIGTGADIVDARRIGRMLERHGGRFLEKVFCAAERERAASLGGEAAVCLLARRWAAKEAAAKALGTGFRDGVGWRDICVGNDAMGCPRLSFSAAAAERLERLTPQGMRARAHLSLSDEYPYAQAFVVIEAI